MRMNSLGPPIKEIVEWKQLNATGGGPNETIQFTSEEEEVLALTSLRLYVYGIKGAKSFRVPTTQILDRRSTTSSELTFNDFDVSDNLSVNLSRGEEPKASCPKRLKEGALNNQRDLLKSQIEIQRDLCNAIKKGIEESKENAKSGQIISRTIYKTLESIENTSKEVLKEIKRHNKVKETLAFEKLKVQKRILELKLERRASDS